MPQPPEITVQIIHIEGPLKGQIQEFPLPQLEIGRHQSCQIKFPADLTIISRKHATILREGNRFKIIDHSGNGTLLNSQPIKEEYLKDGDVVTIAPGGPKFSFLAEINQNVAAAAPPPSTPEPVAEPAITREPSRPAAPVEPQPPPQPEPQPQTPPSPPLPDYQPLPSQQPQPAAPVAPQAVEPVSPGPEKLMSPFVVQFGPTINSFDTTPVTIGRHGGCEFVIDRPGILDHQAQINFRGGRFYLEDRTGQQRVLVNGSPVQQETLLHHNDEIALTGDGPFFRFLEGGRLVEIEKEPVVQEEPPKIDSSPHLSETGSSPSEKIKSLFNKFLKH